MFEDNFHQEQTKELAKALRVALNNVDWEEAGHYMTTEDYTLLDKWWSIVNRKE